jgi:hypothetical protein
VRVKSIDTQFSISIGKKKKNPKTRAAEEQTYTYHLKWRNGFKGGARVGRKEE